MEDIVKQALLKWPNVPDCYGWLGLDARGHWYMRDDRVQAEGPFPQSKGAELLHEKLIAFIERNYESDARGCWFFQNGPQRVYVELQNTPYIWRVHATERGFELQAHSGLGAQMREVFMDAQGKVYALTDLGFGLVHSLDVTVVADALESGAWPDPKLVDEAKLPAEFGFVRSPQQWHRDEPKPPSEGQETSNRA